MIAMAPFVRVLLVMSLVSFAGASALGVSSDAGDSWAVRVPDAPTARQRDKLGYGRFDYQTTFFEGRVGSFAPVNTQTAIGLPGTVPLAFSNLMALRYSEFEIRFGMMTDDGEKFPYLMPGFRQTAPGGWYPGCVSEWDDRGIHYEASVIMVPNEPQPVDLVQIVLKNTSTQAAKGNLMVTLDGAPTLKARNSLISDRDKPLVFMDPVVPTERLARDSGCVDPRNTSGITVPPQGVPGWLNWKWIFCRIGFYGMPVEYMLKAKPGEKLQVFLGFQSTSPALVQQGTSNVVFDDFDNSNPTICREVEAEVEGAPSSQITDTPNAMSYEQLLETRRVLRFVGQDADGDGYIRASVRATPKYRQRPILNVVQAYDIDAKVTTEDVATGKNLPQARYDINCGRDSGNEATLRSAGLDPTVFALRLAYTPTLASGEEKRYLLRIPAIDRPEPRIADTPAPYDTGLTWKLYYSARHPENTAPNGFDVPVGADPSEYAVYGPKPRSVWEKQVAAVKSLDWQGGLDRLRRYWDGFVAKGARFVIPEKSVDQIYRKQIANLAIMRVKFSEKPYYASLDGPEFYWEHTPRGGAYEYVAMDWAGFHDMARESLALWLTPVDKLPLDDRWRAGQYLDGKPETDGMWIVRAGQYDAQGQTLWAVTEHYLLTGDKKWLTKHYDSIARGGDWIIRRIDMERKGIGDPNDPTYGLMPTAGAEPPIGAGHSMYVNGFTIFGLDRCAMMARELGKNTDAVRFENAARDLRKALERAIGMSFVRMNDFIGAIPENVEIGLGFRSGRSAGSLASNFDFCGSLIYPTRAMAPHDPLMNALWKYREKQDSTRGGLMTWPSIHAEDGVGYIVRGEPDKACDLFYAFVANAYRTFDLGECQLLSPDRYPGFPTDVPRYDFMGAGDTPLAWASSFYVEWLRHLMLFEDGDALHIAPATPRKWLAQPKPLGVEGAPSYFGPVTYHLQADPDRTTIRGDVKLDATRKPAKLIIHVRAPGGKGLASVILNGRRWDAFSGDTIIVPNPPAKIRVEARYLP